MDFKTFLVKKFCVLILERLRNFTHTVFMPVFYTTPKIRHKKTESNKLSVFITDASFST